ncbi:unnamed protein product, partial [Closterium sp. NIES-53]
MAPHDLQPLTAALSPLASAPCNPSPLAVAPVPCSILKGKGVARGGSPCPRALQSHAQLRPRPPPPPPPPPWGRGGEGVRGWRMCLSSSSCRRAFSSLSPCRTLCWERGGELGSSGGGRRGSAAPAPPAPPFSSILGGGGGVEGVDAVNHYSQTLCPASPLPRLLLWGGGGGDGG